MATPVPPQTIGKRSRNPTPSRHSSTSTTSPSSSSSSPESKIARSIGNSFQDVEGGKPQQRPILCTLPPTCNRQPTTLANSKDLERHYATYHAHVCESPGCGCVFPEAKLLELHQTECHDPVAAVRKERGERIFGCMVPTCARFFQSPKARRLHMIEAHKYPKEFFFSVTNKGIGGLLKKWGEGASMVRGEWKPRDGKEKQVKDEEGNMAMDDSQEGEGDSSSEEEVKQADIEESEKTPRPTIRPLHPASPPRDASAKSNASMDVDALADGMSSLSLVPNSIRFGRGGRGGGLGARGRARGGRGGIVPPQQYAGAGGIGGGHQKSASMSNSSTSTTPSGGRGRGSKRAGGRGHRFAGSVGGAMSMQMPERGGDVVLLPPATGQENGSRPGGL